MSSAEYADNDCLLAYGIDSEPLPIQVSPQQGNPAYAALTIVVSNNTIQPLYCQRITFNFPTGDLAQDLTEHPAAVLVTASPADQWQITNNRDGSFIATPTRPLYRQITAEGLVFRLYNIEVNKQVGTFTLKIVEQSSTDDESYEERRNNYDLAKFPYGFCVKNFVPSTPMVDNGHRVTLSWIGSELATYHILYDDKTVKVSDTRTWLSPPLNHTTAFILKASVQASGETVNTYLNCTVIVSKPEFTASTLTVTRTSRLQGDTTVGTPQADAALNIFGSSSVSGETSLAGLTASSIQVNDLEVNGSTGIFGDPVAVKAGGYLAKTDGFVVGIVFEAIKDLKYPVKIVGMTWKTSGGKSSNLIVYYATGGNRYNANSFTMPVNKGYKWVVGTDPNPPGTRVDFFWIPLGTHSNDTFEESAFQGDLFNNAEFLNRQK